MWKKLLNTFAQPSTYAGLAGIAAAVGVSQPAYATATTVASALASMAAVLINEKGGSAN